jgi:hypothetical protein
MQLKIENYEKLFSMMKEISRELAVRESSEEENLAICKKNLIESTKTNKK